MASAATPKLTERIEKAWDLIWVKIDTEAGWLTPLSNSFGVFLFVTAHL